MAKEASTAAIKDAQEKLKSYGWYTGAIHGKLDAATRSAIIRLQKARGANQQRATGDLDSETIAALNEPIHDGPIDAADSPKTLTQPVPKAPAQAQNTASTASVSPFISEPRGDITKPLTAFDARDKERPPGVSDAVWNKLKSEMPVPKRPVVPDAGNEVAPPAANPPAPAANPQPAANKPAQSAGDKRIDADLKRQDRAESARGYALKKAGRDADKRPIFSQRDQARQEFADKHGYFPEDVGITLAQPTNVPGDQSAIPKKDRDGANKDAEGNNIPGKYRDLNAAPAPGMTPTKDWDSLFAPQSHEVTQWNVVDPNDASKGYTNASGQYAAPAANGTLVEMGRPLDQALGAHLAGASPDLGAKWQAAQNDPAARADILRSVFPPKGGWVLPSDTAAEVGAGVSGGMRTVSAPQYGGGGFATGMPLPAATPVAPPTSNMPLPSAVPVERKATGERVSLPPGYPAPDMTGIPTS